MEYPLVTGSTVKTSLGVTFAQAESGGRLWSSSQMQPTICLLVMEGTNLGSFFVPEASFGASILKGPSHSMEPS